MYEPMYRELLSYATALVSIQRLEGRHSILKRVLGWKHFQLPASLSATMRRKQNKDLQSLEFQMNLAEYLSEIGTLHNGSWRSKTELLEALARASAEQVPRRTTIPSHCCAHKRMLLLESFLESVQQQQQPVSSSPLPRCSASTCELPCPKDNSTRFLECYIRIVGRFSGSSICIRQQTFICKEHVIWRAMSLGNCFGNDFDIQRTPKSSQVC